MKKTFKRNIGLISEEQQNSLKKSHVLVCGVGGMGGICAEALVRMGINNLTIVDKDKFEYSNFNRQVFSNKDSVGLKKVLVLKKELKKINKNLNIRAIPEKVSAKNIETLLMGVDIVVNAMDDMKSSIILERAAKSKKITIIDAWITPFASVFVMNPEDPHWETFLDFPSKNVPIKKINKKICQESLKKEVDYTFSHFNPYEYVKKDLVDEVVSGKIKRPSFVLVTWFSGLLMANEVFKKICGYKTLDHKGIFFNQYNYDIIKGKL